MSNLEKINSIEIKGLEQLISELVGMPIKFTVSVGLHRNTEDDYYLIIESQELKQFTGIMAGLYKTVKLENFSSAWHSNGLGYWTSIVYSYEFEKGGSNGAKLTEVWFDFETMKWRIL